MIGRKTTTRRAADFVGGRSSKGVVETARSGRSDGDGGESRRETGADSSGGGDSDATGDAGDRAVFRGAEERWWCRRTR